MGQCKARAEGLLEKLYFAAATTTTTSFAPLTIATDGNFTTDQMKKMIMFLCSQLHSQASNHSELSTASSHESPSTPFVSNLCGITLSFSSIFTLPYPLIPHHSWILESGATNHVYCNYALLHHFEPTPNVSISLPNGDRVTVQQTGSCLL